MDIREIEKHITRHVGNLTRIDKQERYGRGYNPAILAPYPKDEPDIRIPIPIARRAVDIVAGYLGKEGNITYAGKGFDDETKKWLDLNDEGLATFGNLKCGLIHGAAYERHWIGKDGKDEFALTPRHESIPIKSNTLKPKLTGFIHWRKVEDQFIADYYDEFMVTRFVSSSYSSGYKIDPDGTKPHPYNRVPVVEFMIDSDGSNLFDHCIALIDFLDNLHSENYANELARHAASIMLTTLRFNTEPDEYGQTDADRVKQTGVIDGLPEPVQNQVAYLTKDLAGTFIEATADRIERLVYEMLSLFNPNDDTFATASGVAQLYKLLGFEYLCTRITSYFMRGLQDRFKLYQRLRGSMTVGAEINTDITIDWRRNLPNDVLNIAQIMALLDGKLSDETLLRMLPASIVPDVEEELKKLKAQQEEATPNVLDVGPEVDEEPTDPEALEDAGA
jgi:SPP1 family phage portal protein